MNRSGIIDVAIDPNQDYVTQDGRRLADVILTLSEDAHVRLRTGYQCVHCQEVFWSAWPERCGLCGFPVASEQRALIEQQFAGHVVLPPAGLTSDELARGEAEYLEKVKKARL